MSQAVPFNRRVLVVDDNPAIHDDFRKVLVTDDGSASSIDREAEQLLGGPKRKGLETVFTLDSAFQGEEAVSIAQKALAAGQPYAMAFVDMRMPPGWDGLETIRRLWQVQPELEIAICTAYSDHSWQEIQQTLGTSDKLLILKKPFDKVEVLQLALALTEKWNLRRLAQIDHKQLEEKFLQSQKVQAIGQLAGGVAHDFNNILTAILGYTDLLLKQLPAQENLHLTAGEIKKAAFRAASLTRQLLAFSRKQVLQPRVLDLNGVVTDMDKMLRPLLGEHIDLVTLPHADLGRVKADPGQIEQVILNLAINARDALPAHGKVTIETGNVTLDAEYCRLRDDVTPGEHVVLAISDNGRGMPPEVKARLFEPFFTTKEVGKGTGLGLATCHGIIKQSGGHIAAYSEINQGTTFKIYLPRVYEALDPATAPEHPIQVGTGTETVLLVEYEPMLRELGLLVLSGLGYRVLPAENGVQALRLLEQHQKQDIHLLVTDVVMPEMGGRELAERLRARSPRTKVLFCSGYTEDAIVHHGRLDGDICFMQKPYTIASLAGKVREVLDLAA